MDEPRTSVEAADPVPRRGILPRLLVIFAGLSVAIGIPVLVVELGIAAEIFPLLGSAESTVWTLWEITSGFALVIATVVLLLLARRWRRAGRRHAWGFVLLALLFLDGGVERLGWVYAWERLSDEWTEDVTLGLAPGSSPLVVWERVKRTSFSVEPEHAELLRGAIRATRHTRCWILWRRFALRETRVYWADEELGLSMISRMRSASPAIGAGSDWVDLHAVDGAWVVDGRSGGTIELDDPEERR